MHPIAPRLHVANVPGASEVSGAGSCIIATGGAILHNTELRLQVPVTTVGVMMAVVGALSSIDKSSDDDILLENILRSDCTGG